jgi:site-specific DNA-methyltransferase (adenine-specific)
MECLYCGDCLEIMRTMESDSVDLVIASPPYEAARAYGIDFNLQGQNWVDWAVSRYVECYRVSRGLVAWVVAGNTRNFRWSATPALLMADLHRQGIKLRTPPIYHRVGIPGSGGPDWWRNDYEFVVCASKGKLPWSDNTAIGHPPKYKPGGTPSHHTRNGRVGGRKYTQPSRANPGNLIWCHGGGNHFGDRLAHENEAPFPEKLAEAFVVSFCKPGGVVLDCFCGSGTTLVAAKQNGRSAIGIDIRSSQIELAQRRLANRDLPTTA